jgi:hypothetical protein
MRVGLVPPLVRARDRARACESTVACGEVMWFTRLVAAPDLLARQSNACSCRMQPRLPQRPML